MAKVVCFVAVVFALAVTSTAAYQQSVAVIGKLLCGKDPVTSKNGWVKVLNKRTGFDDQKEMDTNEDGSFKIKLNVDRMFGLTPELHIYTDCNDKKFGIEKGCQRKIVVKIPSKYVNSNSPYDIGTYQMESKFHDEERDCSVHRSLTG